MRRRARFPPALLAVLLVAAPVDEAYFVVEPSASDAAAGPDTAPGRPDLGRCFAERLKRLELLRLRLKPIGGGGGGEGGSCHLVILAPNGTEALSQALPASPAPEAQGGGGELATAVALVAPRSGWHRICVRCLQRSRWELVVQKGPGAFADKAFRIGDFNVTATREASRLFQNQVLRPLERASKRAGLVFAENELDVSFQEQRQQTLADAGWYLSRCSIFIVLANVAISSCATWSLWSTFKKEKLE